jgi:H+-transporting ATPase
MPMPAHCGVVKGAFSVIGKISSSSAQASAANDELQAKGFRVLAVAYGSVEPLAIIGLIALSDQVRAESASLVTRLRDLGVRTIMVTGDAMRTASFVAEEVGINGKVCAAFPLAKDARADSFAVFASVLPEDKYALVKALQAEGHVVGMCGDGANDAPALRQAQMGIAVFTATHVAKSAAGVVLTEPGLNGVVVAVEEGRKTFQRVMTYTLRSIIQKVVQVLFLLGGLIMSGGAILTPMLMVMMMVAGDFLALSTATDNVRPSLHPNRWDIEHLTIAAVILGLFDLIFCLAVLGIGRFLIGLDNAALQTLTVITLVHQS